MAAPEPAALIARRILRDMNRTLAPFGIPPVKLTGRLVPEITLPWINLWDELPQPRRRPQLRLVPGGLALISADEF